MNPQDKRPLKRKNTTVDPSPVKKEKAPSSLSVGGKESKEHNPYCCSCLRERMTWFCTRCDNTICDVCVELPISNEEMINEGLEFLCPSCHVDLNSIPSSQPPYTGLRPHPNFPSLKPARLKNAAYYGIYPPIQTTSVGIINLRHRSTTPFADPAVIVRETINAYHPVSDTRHSVKYEEVLLDFNPMDRASVTKIQDYLNVLVQDFRLVNLKHIIIFVRVDADVNGGVYCQSGERSALPISQFLDIVFTPALVNLTQRLSSFLVFLASDSDSSDQQSSISLRKFAQSGIVGHVVAFSQSTFRIHVVNSFLMKLFPRIFFHGFDIAVATRWLLDDDMDMGAHTNVYVYSAKVGLAFVWCQMRRHPMGRRIGIQCDCGRLRPFKIDVDANGLCATISCQGCGRLTRAESSPGCRASVLIKKIGSGWAIDAYWGLLPDSLRC